MDTFEKKYNEALERAKQIRYGNPSSGTAIVVCEQIFPELRESEDERIRKWIVGYFTRQEETGINLGMDYCKIFAWLEEQKDKNCLACDQHLKGYLAGRKTTEEEKQKEQKPTWSEEDNIGWDEAFACVTRAEKDAKNEEELQNAVTAEKWLKEIKFKYCVHPVKQEWSEEDDQLIGFIFDLLNDLFWRKDWAMSKEECLDWLKSLRPSWKPSEEQMKAFNGYIEDFQARAEAAVGGWNNFDVMIRLYEQLKKLKED